MSSINEPKHTVPARQTTDFVADYLLVTPLALGLERSMECDLYRSTLLKAPVLDLGCGDGLFASITFGHHALDYGVDPNPTEADRARKRGAYKNVMCQFGNKIDLPDASLNTVISNSVLEHIPDIRSVLIEIHRLLKPQGELHITVPTDQFENCPLLSRILVGLRLHSLHRSYVKFYNSFWSHHHAYSTEQWRRLLKESGFEVLEAQEYCSSTRAAIHDLLVPFALPAFFVNKFFHRYFAFPPLRSLIIQVCRPLLPKSRTERLKPGTGALAYVKAIKME